MPRELVKVMDPFMHYMKDMMPGGKRSEGSSLAYVEEARILWNIAHNIQTVGTVCETGFNTGEGTVLWLSAKPNIQVYSFDIGKHVYAQPAAKYIAEHFPGRHNITWGDSTKTLPRFIASKPRIKCDIMFIDGGHTYEAALSDFDNFAKIAHNGSIVILDNYPDYRQNFMQTLGYVWEMKRRHGELREVFKCFYGQKRKQGFSFGILNK